MPALKAEAALTLLLLVNAKVWTGNPQQPEAEAIAIRGNRIEAVGSTAEMLKRRLPDAHVLDLHGRRVVAGFNDAHVHFYSGGANLT
jgi:predicted amidohydrolase YtcJ